MRVLFTLLLCRITLGRKAEDLHDEYYTCPGIDKEDRSEGKAAQYEIPSVRKVLVVSLGPRYVSDQVLRNVTGKISETIKATNRVVTKSGFLPGTDQCITFLETPEIHSNEEILDVILQIKKRCFQRVVLALNPNQRPSQQEQEVLKALLSVLDSVYNNSDDQFWKSLSLLVLGSPREETYKMINVYIRRLIRDVKKVPDENSVFVRSVGYSPMEEDTFGPLTTELMEVGIGDCRGSSCVQPKGFFGGRPWVGMPYKVVVLPTEELNEINSTDTERILARCYMYDHKKHEGLVLYKDGVEIDTETETLLNIRTAKEGKMYFLEVTASAVDLWENSKTLSGRYECKNRNSSLVSQNAAIVQTRQKPGMRDYAFSEWAEWSKCANVGPAEMSTRTRLCMAGRCKDKDLNETRRCRCSDLSELPHPRILLLGRTGVGKSSFGNQIFGDKKVFGVGHRLESKTTDLSISSDQYLGTGQCITLIDTPGTQDTQGRDYEHSLKMQQILKNDIGSIDVFLLLFNGENTRFDSSTVELLRWYEAIFGPEMWKHVVTETTFWSHSADVVNHRLRERNMDERTRQQAVAKKFHEVLNVPQNIKIPTMFIDPVVDVFSDPCDPTYRRPEAIEKQKFIEWTTRFQETIAEIPPFDCKSRCQAPDAFYSGGPWLHYPEYQSLYVNAGEGCYLEWQIWNGQMEDQPVNYTITLNSQVIYERSENATEEARTIMDGLVVTESSLFDKVTSIRLTMDHVTEEMEGNYILDNGTPSEYSAGRVLVRVDADFTQWSEWTACSVDCLNEQQLYGNRNRTRDCVEGRNNGTTCNRLLREDGEPLVEEVHCAGDDPKPKICPVPPSWSEWTEWSPCNANCGLGSTTRSRMCTDGRYGGPACEENIQQEITECFLMDCPVDCKLGEWSPWSECSAPCLNMAVRADESIDHPVRRRTKDVVQTGNFGGRSCQGFESVEMEPCNMEPCPIDGFWSEWSSFGSCSAPCDPGFQERQRVCQGPFYGGQPCADEDLEQKECEVEECDEGTCEYSQWSAWTSCSEICGVGIRMKMRDITKNVTDCDEDSLMNVEDCFTRMCGEDEYVLDGIFVALGDASYSGSDNSWKIELKGNGKSCSTNWLDRYGNDWSTNSQVTWKHVMDSTYDKFFGSCHGYKFKRGNIPSTLQVDFRGWAASDNINIKEYTVSFQSPAWVGMSLEYHQWGIGWTDVEENDDKYHDAGLTKLSVAPLQNPGRYCCKYITLWIPSDQPHSQLSGTYSGTEMSDDQSHLIYKKLGGKRSSIYYVGRYGCGWTVGRSHRARSLKLNYLFDVDEAMVACPTQSLQWEAVTKEGRVMDMEIISITCNL